MTTGFAAIAAGATAPTVELPPLAPPTSDLQTDIATDGRPSLGVGAPSALVSHYG